LLDILVVVFDLIYVCRRIVLFQTFEQILLTSHEIWVLLVGLWLALLIL